MNNYPEQNEHFDVSRIARAAGCDCPMAISDDVYRLLSDDAALVGENLTRLVRQTIAAVGPQTTHATACEFTCEVFLLQFPQHSWDILDELENGRPMLVSYTFRASVRTLDENGHGILVEFVGRTPDNNSPG